MDHENRVVVLIDMDCFYCQVEEKLDPELKGKPIAVVQYNPWKGGGIIAVNYVARAMGVTRHMRGDEAKEKCPEIQLPSVPCLRGKADITKYREAGVEVAKVLQRYSPLLERASIDEAYMDITASVQKRLDTLPTYSINQMMLPNTYALGYDNMEQFLNDVNKYNNESIEFDLEHTKRLLVGAVIVSEIRDAVFAETGYQCSAGIAHNKILAKLVCGMNKPNKQTILPKHSINTLYRTLPVKKVKHLGGKFGDTVCDVLKISKMGELQSFTEKQLQSVFDEKNGSWLYNIARGIDLEPVQAKFNPKSIGCCKQFRGKSALTDLVSLKKWLKDLADEIEGRLDKDAVENNRSPKQMVVSYATQLSNFKDVSSSRSYNFTNEDELCSDLFYSKAIDIILNSIDDDKDVDNEGNRSLKTPIKFLGISVGKFEDNDKKTKKILDYFAASTSKEIDRTIDVRVNNDTKKSADKGCIMKKYFQVSDKNDSDTSNVINVTEGELEERKSPILQSIAVNLDQQESFFAKYLNNNVLLPKKSPSAPKPEEESNLSENEHSNDSNYSASTINEEINRSISLFENDQSEVTRVSEMRALLNHTMLPIEDKQTSEEEAANTDTSKSSSPQPDTVVCEECGKPITVTLISTHADYHLAVKLRNEEREVVRKEIKDKVNKRATTESKNVSITRFITKLDDNVPKEMCPECGKRIAIDKFQEHQDFHEAQRLSRELNKAITSIKRKRNLSPPDKTKTKVPCRPINSFFR